MKTGLAITTTIVASLLGVVVILSPLASAGPFQNASIEIDHVILGVSDLTRGNRQFEAMTGVAPVFGGVHPGRGTQNSIVSLGPGRYVEILAPTDPAQALEIRAWDIRI